MDDKQVAELLAEERGNAQEQFSIRSAKLRELLAALTTAQARIAEYEALLKSPEAVHIALLRGDIAKPDIRSMLHVYGEGALDKWDGIEAIRHADRVALVEFMADKAKDISDGILETGADGVIKAFEEHRLDAAAREISND